MLENDSPFPHEKSNDADDSASDDDVGGISETRRDAAAGGSR